MILVGFGISIFRAWQNEHFGNKSEKRIVASSIHSNSNTQLISVKTAPNCQSPAHGHQNKFKLTGANKTKSQYPTKPQ